MTDNDLPFVNVPRAPRGSKKGWTILTGQVPPETAERIASLKRMRRELNTSEILHRALEIALPELERDAA